MDNTTWAIVFATLLGPVLAVQAQKWIERSKVRSDEKDDVFRKLMATRATRLSEEHVKALNMIDIAYLSGRPKKRTKEEVAVIQRWAEYRGHLFTDQRGKSEAAVSAWVDSGYNLFAEMLMAMAAERGHEFDKHTLGTGGYFPIAHGNALIQQEKARDLFIEVLSGNRPISMSIKDMQSDPE